MIVEHKHVTTEWKTPGYFGRFDCKCCGFSVLGGGRALIVRHKTGRAEAAICDGCVNAIATQADGIEIFMNGQPE